MRKDLIRMLLLLVVLGLGCTKPNREDLPRISKEIATQLVENKFKPITKRFNSEVTKVLSAQLLENSWNTTVIKMGSFKQLGDIRSEIEDNYDVYYVNCIFEKNELMLKIVYDSSLKVGGLYFIPKQPLVTYQIPDYADSTLMIPEEITFGLKGWELPGSLFLPGKKGKYPAVVLIHGSGPQDRFESIGPNKMFLDLAYGLVKEGYAVLCYEKRTRQYASRFVDGTVSTITVKEESMDDAIAAGEFLKNHPRIKADKIILAGHSMGGMLIPRIAQQTSIFAAYILMAANARPLEDVLLEQVNYVYTLGGEISEKNKAVLDDLKKKIEMVKSPTLSVRTLPTALPYNTPASYWLDLRGYSPAETAKKITKPILIIQGQRDYQVTFPDYKEWQKALQKNKNVKFRAYPDLNHLFMIGQGMSYPNEYQIPNHVDLQVISEIAKWMNKI